MFVTLRIIYTRVFNVIYLDTLFILFIVIYRPTEVISDKKNIYIYIYRMFIFEKHFSKAVFSPDCTLASRQLFRSNRQISTSTFNKRHNRQRSTRIQLDLGFRKKKNCWKLADSWLWDVLFSRGLHGEETFFFFGVHFSSFYFVFYAVTIFVDLCVNRETAWTVSNTSCSGRRTRITFSACPRAREFRFSFHRFMFCFPFGQAVFGVVRRHPLLVFIYFLFSPSRKTNRFWSYARGARICLVRTVVFDRAGVRALRGKLDKFSAVLRL